MDHQNKFQELENKIFDLKKLEGPVYSIERRHHFNEIDEKMDQLRQMNYPIREGVDPHHLYGQLEAQVNEMKTLTGPIYEVERTHKFNQVEKKISELKTLFGPCYDVLHQNRFQEIESHVEKLKHLQVSGTTNIPIVLIFISLPPFSLSYLEIYKKNINCYTATYRALYTTFKTSITSLRL